MCYMFSELILSRQNHHQSGTTVKKYSAEISRNLNWKSGTPMTQRH